jgi:hypothetical protein
MRPPKPPVGYRLAKRGERLTKHPVAWDRLTACWSLLDPCWVGERAPRSPRMAVKINAALKESKP